MQEVILIARSKYNVNYEKGERIFNDMVFDSEGEMKMYRDLLLPNLEDGAILSIDCQVPFVLQEGFVRDGKPIKPIIYIADFVVKFKCGQTIVFDFKGMSDTVAQLKRKMFWKNYPELPLYWVGFSKVDGGYRTYERIREGRRERRKRRHR